MSKRENYCRQILEIWNQCGVKSLTMEHIADRLGITKRTLYNHFCDREQMLREVLDVYANESFEKIENISSQSELNAITVQTHIVEYMTYSHQRLSPIFVKSIFEAYPDFFTHYDELRQERVQQFFATNIERGRAEGLYHSDFDTQIISRYIFRAFDSFWLELLCNTDEYYAKNAIRHITCCLLRGLVTPSGSEILEMEIKRIFNR